jgi:hypothetical protein
VSFAKFHTVGDDSRVVVPMHRVLFPLAFALLVLGVAAAVEACESSNSMASDSCDSACPGATQCATVCTCNDADCPSFACVNFEGGAYYLPDGAPISSCSNP